MVHTDITSAQLAAQYIREILVYYKVEDQFMDVILRSESSDRILRFSQIPDIGFVVETQIENEISFFLWSLDPDEMPGVARVEVEEQKVDVFRVRNMTDSEIVALCLCFGTFGLIQKCCKQFQPQ